MDFLTDGSITTPDGFLAGTAASGIKDASLDVALVYSQQPCQAAAVFTRNQVVAAPVIIDRQTLADNKNSIHAVTVNSGNANACTGAQGLENATRVQEATAAVLDCQADEVLVLSTGVIGVQMPMEKVIAGINQAAQNMSTESGPWAAEAIMTTDTRPKYAAVRIELADGPITIGGIAKGAGMIHPNMATLLGVHTTDADIEAELLQACLRTAVDQSYNRISVDGDTSTNDTILLMANGNSGVKVGDEQSITLFQEALNSLTRYLAQQVVRDGEGASKFVEITVAGAEDDLAAHTIANTIATSALVKTAFAGSDANWGRILAAAGRAGVPFDQYKTALWAGKKQSRELHLLDNGTPTRYQEADAAAIFAEPEFKILFELQQGDGTSTVWTSDLTHEYVSINADYRS
ncbi:MAG: bifunctional glutamate N-acetyltransferase/amino-acid acetyltransferase ArgJ [Candidatus Promineifilaceae bacterium]|jgi:glutamate N-acetyltransferase/amino-acid N-acetyltransferase